MSRLPLLEVAYLQKLDRHQAGEAYEGEENEFHQINNLEVLVIPTKQRVVRDYSNDLIFRTKREKFNAIAQRRTPQERVRDRSRRRSARLRQHRH